MSLLYLELDAASHSSYLMSVWENVSMIGRLNLHLTCFAVKQIIRGLFWCFVFLVNTLRGITSFIECPCFKFVSSTSWCIITQFMSVLKDRGITCGKKLGVFSLFFISGPGFIPPVLYDIHNFFLHPLLCKFYLSISKSYRNNLHCSYDGGVKAITETVSMLLFVGRGHR